MIDKERHLYGSEYWDIREDVRREIAYKQDADKIRARKRCGYVLDIGGGYGEFGCYLNDFAVYYNYDPMTLKNELPNFLVDVVVFRGVLQHIYNPVEMLDKAYKLLDAGGLLAILATPDTDSIGYFRWKTLPALDPERNWLPFGHRMLNNILIRLGYNEIEFEWPYGKPYARPLMNLLNFIIGKPDAFPGNMMNCFAKKGQ